MPQRGYLGGSAEKPRNLLVRRVSRKYKGYVTATWGRLSTDKLGFTGRDQVGSKGQFFC